ncbi:MAG: UDP-N-acetylmuramate--L-alanine ligase [Ruminiclostridium sp.]|nr:UDP-N-acetylmuramate--L-alanine ligase [Ruminiclostridium sp.]
MAIDRIHDYLIPGKRAHLVGIGGVSMSPLAEVLKGEGIQITGSDMKESDTVQHLRSLGIPVVIGHLPESVEGADLVIRTAAVHDSNPEIAAALAKGIPVFERAEAWGSIMRRYENAVCISGTHGKTSTTSMCTHIAMAASIDPTVMIGGTLPLLGTGHRVGKGDTIILESCEYCNSFLSFYPTVAVILNIEADHLDFFEDLQDVEKSFRKFADLVPPTGAVLANCEDENTMKALEGKDNVLTFGVEKGDFHAANLTWDHGFPTFDILWNGKPSAHITLQVPGMHNVQNAIAAAASALVLGVSGEAIARGLFSYHGAGRRFEYKGTVKGAKVYDDYAHHPSELKALLNMASSLGYKRVICAFQPHTYTRTHALFDEFAQVLQGADKVFLAEIFAAREKNEVGISSEDLAKVVPGAKAAPSLEVLTDWLYDLASPGDLILTVGAGVLYTVAEELVRRGGETE